MNRLSLHDIRSSLWAMAGAAGVVSFGCALLLLQVRTGDPGWLGQITWPGDRSSASTTLQVIATSSITVTSLTFSLVVIALQLASQQFSPRLLRQFARDLVIQAVLSVLIATFVFALTTSRALDSQLPLPGASLFVAFGLGLASIAALVGFLAHIVRTLRVDTMMVGVHEAAARVVDGAYPPYDDPPARPDRPLPELGAGDNVVTARRSGFLRTIDTERLVAAASRAEALVVLVVRAGDHVTVGSPVAQWLPSTRDGDAGELPDAVHRGLELGYERTLEQDLAFAFRQLSDVAVKALSPSINDPATTAHAVGFMADLLVRVVGRSLGPGVHFDDAGQARLVVPDRDVRYYLDLACGLVRRFGRREPIALVALLGMLRDVAAAARDDEQRAEVDRQVELILDEMSGDLIAHDEEVVADMARRVRAALRGDVGDAYFDRSGETRST